MLIKNIPLYQQNLHLVNRFYKVYMNNLILFLKALRDVAVLTLFCPEYQYPLILPGGRGKNALSPLFLNKHPIDFKLGRKVCYNTNFLKKSYGGAPLVQNFDHLCTFLWN